MASKRRHWLAALGLFLATVIGGVVAYLVARRSRREELSPPEDASLADLSARLRREAASQEQRLRRRLGRIRWRRGGRRRQMTEGPAQQQDEGEPAAALPKGGADAAEALEPPGDAGPASPS